jgi:hypothetical protein
MIKGRYALESVLDHVHVGTMYRAVDVQDSHDGRIRYVSVWVLPAQIAAQPAALASLQRDFLRIRQLVHPNVARVVDLDRDGDTVFIVGEFVDAETLRTVLDHLRPDRLTVAEADGIVAAVATALEHAHARGIAHGAVRAENVLVTLDRRFKLANFLSTTATRGGLFAARPADDVRDLAALAYELYVGEPAPQVPPARLRAKGLPRRRARAIAAALAEDRRRFTSVRAFMKAAGLKAQAPSPAQTVGRTPRREPGRALRWPVLVGALGVAAIGAGLFAARDGHWTAAAKIDDWGKQVIERWAAGMPALRSALPDRLPERPRAPATRSPAPVAEETPRTAAADPAPLPEAPAIEPQLPPDETAEPQIAPGGGEPNAAPAGESAAGAGEPEQPAAGPGPAIARPPETTPAAAAPPPAHAAGATPAGPPIVEFSVSAVTAREGRPVAAIELQRTGRLDAAVEIVWWTSDGTARSPDDYAAFGRRVERLAPGEASRTLHVPIASDSLPEPDEHFVVHLDRRARGADVGRRSSVQVTIVDDDL